MDETSDDPLKTLEKAYCPPLDAALFTAIVFDYDITDPAQLQQLRETLDTLKLSAWEQEDLPFDPSGTSGLNLGSGFDVDAILSEPSGSQNDTVRSRETDLTSELSSLSVGDKGRPGCSSRVSYIIGSDGTLSLFGATEEDKIFYLAEMFPSAERFTIQHTLKKANGDVDRSMDILLNLAFFDEQPSVEDGTKVLVPKGVDGFEDGGGGGGRKKGRKRKGKNKSGRSEVPSPLSSDLEPLSPDTSSTANKWDAALRDVDFIFSRTFPILKKETITSTYHANGASLPATIRCLADANAPKVVPTSNEHPVIGAQVAELTQEFPSLAPTLLAGLLEITRNSISAAHELAAALLASPTTQPVTELIKFTTSPPPVDAEQAVPKKRTTESRSSSSQNYEQVSISAGYHFSAGAEALSKASAAYKRGKSDRLMGGAAAYYSAVGRDYLERAKREAAAAADALADSQSTWNTLDLHGVSVQDAVRIAAARVSQWWESLGDSKYMRGSSGDPARGGYRIITGLGRHSHDGTSRLGPAVGKMLAREGWKVEVGEGILTVVGAVRRR
ncbi:hypothetical protein P175DRAFT_0497447 [Aspergillus ochraceoroseus IBT 24754]|uniref:Smr domain-containing protein n=2 Tax=Aspergillus ochraceoroseus TaxID=138278 RepID=A0A2T5M720_9EURO|nr:uncharacterized protein P175DRAFT_0497447 [Aspergillus ochraceoroseus IBT 24754]KKK16960.1 hypothetical protein AOCH_007714 [Aspergillus ochraceoroseus]PTU24329.1 hypothetical protein P175DRAFT_0497447 [Aspergillus ochraceoroseus IBT 24754]